MPPIVLLSEMRDGQEADLFALLSSKQEMTTRDGKPYYRVGFRDARREVQFPIWSDSPWAIACREEWTPGAFYKLRATYRETNYGPQLEIRRIRPVSDADDEFDPGQLMPQSRFDPESMFDELSGIATQKIGDRSLAGLVVAILTEHRDALLRYPAARRNHHAYAAGLLEHVLSVTRTALFLAEKYDDYYPDLSPRLDIGLVVAGAILHDIGKLRELEPSVDAADYTPAGRLIGHVLQGRDLVREAAAAHPIDGETLLRLEHVVISHQRLPEWGSPKPPMTPEALIVHYADDLDAKYHMMYRALADTSSPSLFTTGRNPLGNDVYRGSEPDAD